MIDELERFADEQAEISRMKLLDNDKGLRQAFCLGLIAGVFIATVFALIV